jgi:defect-in-organelle-trafficking protein DotC
MKLKIFCLFIVTFFLLSCAKPKPQPYVVPALQTTVTTSKTNDIRITAIQNTALSVGAQGGLAWRSHQINARLTKEADYLNRIFNFNSLLLKNNVLPPVLAEGQTALNLADPNTIRLADRIYKIVSPPRFVTAAPNWRDYLWQNYRSPDPPNASLLPKNEEERQLWNRCVQQGWQAGIDQADQIFSVNLGRLKRDYAGMILYRELLAKNMVTPPYVAKLDLGITGDSNLIRINDQVLRITATSKLNPNANTWRAVVTPGYAGGENQDLDQAHPPP